MASEPSWEVFSLRTLYYHDLTQLSSEENLEELLMSAFSAAFDIFLLPGRLSGIPALLAKLVSEGKISYATFEKQILKVLILKMSAFSSRYR